jgi:hypothetical protein
MEAVGLSSSTRRVVGPLVDVFFWVVRDDALGERAFAGLRRGSGRKGSRVIDPSQAVPSRTYKAYTPAWMEQGEMMDQG